MRCGYRIRAGVTERRQAIEVFLRRLVAEIEDVRSTGADTSQEIAEALNSRRITTRKGRSWTAGTVRKFLSSPGAKRHGAGGCEC